MRLLSNAVAMLVGVLTPAVLVASGQLAAEELVKAAVAASLRNALEEIAVDFEKMHARRVRLTYGVTGNFVRQIEQGAPFELLFAADEDSVERLVAGRFTVGPATTLVRGRIALVVRRDSNFDFGSGLSALKGPLEKNQIRRFAIANPELAPYGRAAREALGRSGLWVSTAPLIVNADNVGQASQFVASGAADAGIVAYSLTIAEPLASALRSTLIDESLHAPIRQAFIVLKGASPAAHQLAAFVRTPAARVILERHGFAVP